MILNDSQITELARRDGMIYPFVPIMDTSGYHRSHGYRAISYGLGSYGYDPRLADEEIKVFRYISPDHNRPGADHDAYSTIDPKRFNPALLEEKKLLDDANGRYFILPPQSYFLGHTVEVFKMPSNITGVAVGKSTYARCGLVMNVTPLEAGWEGQLVLEGCNATGNPLKVYVNEGIIQIQFYRGEPCDTPYSHRQGGGKYQGQRGTQIAKV